MSGPASIGAYLAELEDSLNVRLARQNRIVAEVGSHLREAASSEERRGAGREQAERRAIADFGPPQQLAASFGTEGLGPLGKLAVAAADVCYLVWTAPDRRRLVVRSAGFGLAIALLSGLLFTLGSHQGPGEAAREVLLPAAFGALLLLAVEAWPLRALPRPGYGRRWLKLTPAARERVVCALRRGEALCDPTEAEFARELRARTRRGSDKLWLNALVFALLAYSSLQRHVQAGDLLWLLVMVWLVGSGLLRKRRNAPGLALAELAGLEVLVDAAHDVIRRGQAHLLERTHENILKHPDQFYFVLTPVEPEACCVSLAAGTDTIYVWVRDTLHQFGHHEEGLGELRNYLASVIAQGFAPAETA